MRIGIDATALWGADQDAPSGMVNYTLQIMRALLRVDASNEYFLYFRNDLPTNMPGSDRAQKRILVSRNRKILQQTRLPVAARSDRLDLMFFPFNSAALWCHCASVVTIHDLHPFTVPDSFAHVHGTHVHRTSTRSKINQWYWKTILRLSSARSTRVLAVSGITKRDLVDVFGIPAAKIDVVHEGVDQELFAESPTINGSEFRKSHGLPEQYILCVGTHGYKNLEGSIRSLPLVQRRMGRGLKLVIAGARNFLTDDKLRLVQDLGLDEDVIFTGFFPDDHLDSLYRNAELLLFPSHYEGFGLPVLEAFACGTPVVVSSAGALPEVAGDAAVIVDPDDPGAIADGVVSILNDAALRTELRQRGLRRVRAFTWDEAARGTLRVFRTSWEQFNNRELDQ